VRATNHLSHQSSISQITSGRMSHRTSNTQPWASTIRVVHTLVVCWTMVRPMHGQTSWAVRVSSLCRSRVIYSRRPQRRNRPSFHSAVVFLVVVLVLYILLRVLHRFLYRPPALRGRSIKPLLQHRVQCLRSALSASVQQSMCSRIISPSYSTDNCRIILPLPPFSRNL